jgi:hypothetical protein
MSLLSENEIVTLVKNKFEDSGYKIEVNAVVYKNFIADIVAEKDSKKYLIEVKTTRNDIISSFIYQKKLILLPEISFIILAIPDGLEQDDITRLAQRSGFGLYKVSQTEVKEVVKPREFALGNLAGGGGYPAFVIPGQVFNVRIDLEANSKIIQNIEVSYLPGGPFYVPEGESIPKKIDEVIPGEEKSIEFKVGLREDAEPDIYPLYIEKRIRGEVDLDWHNIQVQRKTEETVRQVVSNARDMLNQAVTTNIENALKEIDDAIEQRIIDISNNILDKSIWNDIGGFCLEKGLFQQAELIYRKMLETIQKQEQKIGKRLHKGLALHNLGISLYSQGKNLEARDCFTNAYQEDEIQYGKAIAETNLAKKALIQLFEK